MLNPEYGLLVRCHFASSIPGVQNWRSTYHLAICFLVSIVSDCCFCAIFDWLLVCLCYCSSLWYWSYMAAGVFHVDAVAFCCFQVKLVNVMYLHVIFWSCFCMLHFPFLPTSIYSGLPFQFVAIPCVHSWTHPLPVGLTDSVPSSARWGCLPVLHDDSSRYSTLCVRLPSYVRRQLGLLEWLTTY